MPSSAWLNGPGFPSKCWIIWEPPVNPVRNVHSDVFSVTLWWFWNAQVTKKNFLQREYKTPRFQLFFLGGGALFESYECIHTRACQMCEINSAVIQSSHTAHQIPTAFHCFLWQQARLYNTFISLINCPQLLIFYKLSSAWIRFEFNKFGCWEF